MGFDISYHPIRQDQMNLWFFQPLKALQNGDDSVIQDIIQKQPETFFAEKYSYVLQSIVNQLDLPAEKGLLYGMAVISGLFTRYQYIRGTAYSFLLEKHPEMEKYCSPWSSFLPDWVKAPVHSRIEENYSSGIYMNPDQVKALLSDYENDETIHEILKDFFATNLEVFLLALQEASDTNSGLMEATEIIEVDPFDINKSTCYSDIRFCDPKGTYVYHDVAIAQFKELTGMEEKEILQKIVSQEIIYQKNAIDIPDTTKQTSSAPEKKKGFFSRLFKRK